MSNKDKKEIVIIAGANGSGKTTFARKFLDITQYEFLNADEFAKEISPEDPSLARIAAGKKVIRSIDKFINEGKSFVIESTLSGSFLEKHIARLKNNGYAVKLIFIFLASRELCIERIKSRVLQGGHNIPDKDVIRRFDRGLIKFWNDYRMQADSYSLFFNNEFYDFKQIAQGKAEELEIISEPLFKEFIQILEELEDE
jgi:predicted ABC-type ATPase